MTEEGIDRPEHARELAIQRLKMKQDFKGIAAGGAFAGWKAYGPSNRITEADVQREMERG